MKRVALVIAFLALLVSLIGARRIDAVLDNRGVWHVTYWTAAGPFSHQITEREYERFRRGGSCMPSSHFSSWPHEREIQVICEV